jgi:hypothetical protein
MSTYTSLGEMDIAECDNANIPVCCFWREPSDEQRSWGWTAHNYMPRKDFCAEGAYHLVADSKEAIQLAINKHVIPLYEAALAKLRNGENCYYWTLPPLTPPEREK